jgi:hypothetical protein
MTIQDHGRRAFGRGPLDERPLDPTGRLGDLNLCRIRIFER